MLLRIAQVKDMTGLSRSTIYSWVQQRKSPPPITLGPRSVAWVQEEVAGWVRGRIEESRRGTQGRATRPVRAQSG